MYGKILNLNDFDKKMEKSKCSVLNLMIEDHLSQIKPDVEKSNFLVP